MARITCDVENNVTYNNVGHCFFLEDGVEHGNQFVHNLGILTKCHPDAPCVPTNLAAVRSESRHGLRYEWPERQGCPASLRQHGVDFLDHQSGQHLPGQRGRGFRLERLLDVACRSTRRVSSKARRSARRPGRVERQFREFKGNVAHSNYDAFMFDRNIAPNGTFQRYRQLAYRP